MTTPITLLRGESKEKTDEMERKYNIDPDIIPEKTCDTRLYSGDWSVPTPLTYGLCGRKDIRAKRL